MTASFAKVSIKGEESKVRVNKTIPPRPVIPTHASIYNQNAT